LPQKRETVTEFSTSILEFLTVLFSSWNGLNSHFGIRAILPDAEHAVDLDVPFPFWDFINFETGMQSRLI